MVLSTTKKTSSISSIVNRPQGGGNMKPGSFPQIGRSSWSSIAYGSNSIPSVNCCKQSNMVRLSFTRNFNRNIGSTIRTNNY
jgi:hypothetical protein